MFGFGMAEVIIILVLALIVLGPGNPPQPGQALGSGIRNFRKAASGDNVKPLERQ